LRLLSVLFFASFAWTLAVLAAPVLETPIVYAAGSLVCHQIPERSFHLDGAPVAVCARCLGLYAGGVLGFGLTWASGLRRWRWTFRPAVARRVLVLAALPTAATLLAEWGAGWPVGNAWRWAAALPLGLTAAAGIGLAVLADLRRFAATEVD